MKKKLISAATTAFLAFSAIAQSWTPGTGAVYTSPTTTKVGIGITTPVSLLQVAEGDLKLGSTAGAFPTKNRLLFGDGEYIQMGELEADDRLTFKANSGFNFIGGSVGIGLASGTTPQSKIHIEANGTTGLLLNHTATSAAAVCTQINTNRNDSKAFVINNTAISPSKEVVRILGNGNIVTDGSNGGGGFFANNIIQWGYGFSAKASHENAKAFCLTDKNNIEVFYVMGNGIVNAKKIYAESIDVRPDALSIFWYDHVFSSSYKLQSLSDVENYIKLNKHLPDIPSETEVKQNGFNMAAMDGLLLKKIEELTLYVIQQQKEIEMLKKTKN